MLCCHFFLRHPDTQSNARESISMLIKCKYEFEIINEICRPSPEKKKKLNKLKMVIFFVVFHNFFFVHLRTQQHVIDKAYAADRYYIWPHIILTPCNNHSNAFATDELENDYKKQMKMG